MLLACLGGASRAPILLLGLGPSNINIVEKLTLSWHGVHATQYTPTIRCRLMDYAPVAVICCPAWTDC